MMKGVHFTFTATNKAAPAMSSFSRGLQNVKQQTDAATKTNTSFMRGMSDNRRAIQNAGFQVGDFAVQLAGGQNAMLAFSQQGGQMLQFFGAFGAVAGAALAIAAAVALSMGAMATKADALKDALKSLGDMTTDLNSKMEMLRFGVDSEAEATALRSLYDIEKRRYALREEARNTDSLSRRQAIAEEDRELNRQFHTQKAIVDEIGKRREALAQANLIAQGMAAVELGHARAMGNLERERIALGNQIHTQMIAIQSAHKQANDAQASMNSKLVTAYGLYANLRTQAADLARNAVAAQIDTGMAAVQLGHYRAMGNLERERLATGAKIHTQMIAIQSAHKQANDAQASMNSKLAAAYGLYANLRTQAQGLARDAAAAAQAATDPWRFKLAGAYGLYASSRMAAPSVPPPPPKVDTTDVLADLQKQLALETELLGKTEAQQRVIQALGADWQSYGDVVINGLTGQIQQIEAFNQKVAEQQNLANTIKSSMENAFMGIVSGTMKAKDAFRQMAASIISELFKVLVVQKLVGSFNSTTGAGSGLMGFIGKALSFDGGGYTGYGARSGGVDGKGGFPAILHPNETVVDHTKGGSGGVTVVQNNTFGSGVTRAEVQSMLPKMVEASKRAVLDAKQRGGRYGQAMA